MDIQDAASVVSLVCSTSKIAWAHVDRGMMVQEWQQMECPNFLKGTYMASAYLNDVSTAASAGMNLSPFLNDTRVINVHVVPVFEVFRGFDMNFVPASSGFCSCLPAPVCGLLHRREILHLSPEYSAVSRHGPHEGSGGHAVRPTRTKTRTH